MQQKRNTKQKTAIFSELRSRRDHPSATMLYETLRQVYPHISKATVYRVLRTAAEEGEILCLHVNTEDRFDGAEEGHCHIVCEHCHDICDVPFPRGTLPELESASGYTVLPRHVEFYGLCPRCRAREESETP